MRTNVCNLIIRIFVPFVKQKIKDLHFFEDLTGILLEMAIEPNNLS